MRAAWIEIPSGASALNSVSGTISACGVRTPIRIFPHPSGCHMLHPSDKMIHERYSRLARTSIRSWSAQDQKRLASTQVFARVNPSHPTGGGKNLGDACLFFAVHVTPIYGPAFI